MSKIIRLGIIVLLLGGILNASLQINADIRQAIPVGTTASGTIEIWGPGVSEYGASTLYNVKISVEDMFRGEQAWVLIRTADPANPPPKEGFEYLLARIHVACSDQSVSSSIFYAVKSDNFKVYDANGEAYVLPDVTAPEPGLIGKTLHPGDIAEGWIAFLVARNHSHPLMFFSAVSGFDFLHPSEHLVCLVTDSLTAASSIMALPVSDLELLRRIFPILWFSSWQWYSCKRQYIQ